MEKNYTIAETSRLAAVRGGAHIWSMIADEDIENGQYGYVGTMSKDEEGHEVYEFKTFDTSALNKHRVVLVAHPEWNYETDSLTNQALGNYINAAGIPFRAFDLIPGDIFAVSENGFDTSGSSSQIEAGYYVTTKEDDRKWKVVKTEDETKGSAFVGIVDEIVVRGGGYTAKNKTQYGRTYKMVRVRVIKNDIVADAE